MDIKSVLKRNKVISKIYFFPLKVKMKRLNLILEKEKTDRNNGLIDIRYSKLYDLKDKFVGKRCFIVATGPSLKIEDLTKLKDEICFSMNSICKLFNQTAWRPDYYGIQDSGVFFNMQPYIIQYKDEFKGIFMSDEIYGYLLKNDPNLDKSFNNIVKYSYNSAYHFYDQQFNKFYSKFSENAYGIVYDGYSITYSLLQIAVYMGFKEIFLLGCDCNYPKGQRNHIVESGYVDKYEYLNYDKMMTGYIEAKKYADEHGIKIINCTRGGMLEVFPRMTLEEVLK